MESSIFMQKKIKILVTKNEHRMKNARQYVRGIFCTNTDCFSHHNTLWSRRYAKGLKELMIRCEGDLSHVSYLQQRKNSEKMIKESLISKCKNPLQMTLFRSADLKFSGTANWASQKAKAVALRRFCERKEFRHSQNRRVSN